VIKDAARLEAVTIEWGGDWKSFKDGPHWQLPWASYPAD
jgi:peptidoglycan L-alanyl-D-glutamate endopeptidase CwlK